MQVPAIELRQLVKCYGKRRALDDLTVTVASGGVVGFLGVNGAGKSTTMRILAGYLAPTSGTATVCGIDVAADSLAVRECVGYLPENNPLYPEMRVTEYLRFRARLKGVSRGVRAGAVERVVRSCRLDDASGRLIGQLSKGYRQRVGLADCLLTEAPLLILDEPMAGLDPNQARQTRQLIAEIGRTRTVFLSTHALGDVESICREAVIIHRGRLVAVDTPQGLLSRGTRQRFRLEILGEAETVRRAIAALPGVVTVHIVEDFAPEAVLAVECRAGTDPEGAIRAAAASGGWTVTAIACEPVRLDDIFADLTEGAE